MCLSRLKVLLETGNTVFDAGTGSGILAIAAAMLGADHVLAVEIDADAADSAMRNIEANGVYERVKLVNDDVAAEAERSILSDARFDLITANLTCSILETLLPVFKPLLKDEGRMILSGVLDAQEERIVAALENEGLHAVEIIKDGEWLMLEVRK